MGWWLNDFYYARSVETVEHKDSDQNRSAGSMEGFDIFVLSVGFDGNSFEAPLFSVLRRFWIPGCVIVREDCMGGVVFAELWCRSGDGNGRYGCPGLCRDMGCLG